MTAPDMTKPDITAADRGLMVVTPGDVRLQKRAPVVPADGELLVEPDLVGLCGTDLEIIDGLIDPAYIRYPLALGHEWTGLVVGDSPLAGHRVAVEGIIGCGHCARCSAGQTNLCETYDEIGSPGTELRPARSPSRLAWRTGLIPRSRPRTRC